MKYLNQLVFVNTTILLLLSSCKKSDAEVTPLASLNIINTVVGGASVKINSLSTIVANNSNAAFGLSIGNPDMYVFPVSDSLHPYYNANKSVAINASDIYTLFLGGTTTAVDAILIKENIPNRIDSTAGIRFINLSPNSTPVNVTLSTSTTINEFSNISYKGLTDFKSYPALSTNTAYTFQVRSVASPTTVLASISLTGTSLTTGIPRFKNITIVFRGLVGGSPAPGITRVNHY